MSRTSLRTFAVGAAMTAALSLSACGTTPGERAISGGLLGAGAGAAFSGVTGGDVGTGAIIGGLGGAAAGALTDPCTLNFGDPFWSNRSREDYYRLCGRWP